jgi:hypothetical protein
MATDHITLEAVRRVMREYPGIKAYEIAAKLAPMGVSTAEKHVRSVRAEWLNKEKAE